MITINSSYCWCITVFVNRQTD